jgi:Holliday junction DNA helicase RuvA
MISHLSGTVISTNTHSAVIDVGGVGYLVSTTAQVLSTLHEGQNTSLWTYLAVRETALDLYGFTDKDELAFFELLITISGIGPKTALGILNIASIKMLRNAVFTEDTTELTKVSGISKKNAEKIVLELSGKLGVAVAGDETAITDDSDVIEALTALGYSQKEAREAMKKVPKEITGASERVKHSLKILGNKN